MAANFVDLPLTNARQITATDLNSAFQSVDVGAGVATGKFGVTGWLEPVIAATESATHLVSLSGKGVSAGVFGTRASDNASAGSMAGFAIGGFALNNNTVQRPMYSGYFETRRYAGAGAGQAIELCVTNAENATVRTPFDITSPTDTICLLVGSGRLDFPNRDNTAGILLGGGAGGTSPAIDPRFLSGIVVGPNALRKGAHPSHPSDRAVAMDMPGMHSVVWRNRTTGTISGYVSSSTTADGGGGHVDFTETGITLQSHKGAANIVLSDTTAAITGNLMVSAVLTVSGGANITGVVGIAGKITAYGGMRLTVTNYANDGSAGAAGLGSGDVYFNSTINGLSVKI